MTINLLNPLDILLAVCFHIKKTSDMWRKVFTCILNSEGTTREKWLSSEEIDTERQIQMLDEAICIWENVNILEKGTHPAILIPTILPLAKG